MNIAIVGAHMRDYGAVRDALAGQDATVYRALDAATAKTPSSRTRCTQSRSCSGRTWAAWRQTCTTSRCTACGWASSLPAATTTPPTRPRLRRAKLEATNTRGWPRTGTTWLSHRDLAGLVEARLRDDSVTFEFFNGVSDNESRWLGIERASQTIGYDPVDDGANWDGPPE